MTFSSHVFSKGRERGEKDGEREERLLIFKQTERGKEGVWRDRKRGRVRRRKSREKEMLWDLFFSLAPGTYIKMLILVFFVSFYNSLHFVPLSALFLCRSYSCTFLWLSISSVLSRAPPRLVLLAKGFQL